MKKNTFLKILVLLVAVVLLTGALSVTVSAFEPYETYTYSIDGLPLQSPPAYSAIDNFDSVRMNLVQEKFGNLALKNASDVVADNDGNLYIADRGNNRIVVLNKYYSAIATISSYVDEYGKPRTLKEPQGVFVTNPELMVDGSSHIYVCDTGNKQVVVFDRDYNYVRTISKPADNILEAEAFVPTSMAVDRYGRIFIVSTSCFEGVIVMSQEGKFTGFIGAQKVTYSLIQMIWRRFQTREQKKAQVSNISVAYNNITVDDDGFVYVTTSNLDAKKQMAAIKSKSATYSPVKKLNSAGDEIMNRNGFFDPGGEVDVFYPDEVSKITDVAVGAEGFWTILDSSRSRTFTYDQSGNLLFAYGDRGDQLGNSENCVGMTYQVVDGVYYLVMLDNAANGYRITVYAPTPYCDTIVSALHNQNEHNYSESIVYWQQVLTENNNFDLAYIGIGKALYNQGKYQQAREMLASAYETSKYSDAFSEVRKQILGKWLLPVIIGLIVLVVLIIRFLGYAKRKNKATSLKVGRKTYWEELLYSFHLITHPFDGFWDLKHEQRGSLRGAFTIMGITVLAFFYQSIGRGYIFNPRGTYSTIFVQILAVMVPVLLWAVANWCLTTLFDGEGSFKDILVATGYSLAPLPFFVILSTILSNVLTRAEGSIVSLLVTIGYIWVGFLLFFGMLVTHDYSLSKNVVITLFTILAMAVIMFVAVLFSSLVAKMVSFFVSLLSEIGNRIG